MVFEDYKGQKIELSTEVWESHIQVNHPEINIADIEFTLTDPDEVLVSQSRNDTELYYRRKKTSASNKVRYLMVVVKNMSTNAFVSSAMTKSTVIGSSVIYKK